MPRRNDLHTILIIGSGPIVIGQACEFDYSGTQACRVLKEEGYRVILANSNPATIMTDPDFADRTYIEPIAALLFFGPVARQAFGGKDRRDLALEVHRRRLRGAEDCDRERFQHRRHIE